MERIGAGFPGLWPGRKPWEIGRNNNGVKGQTGVTKDVFQVRFASANIPVPKDLARVQHELDQAFILTGRYIKAYDKALLPRLKIRLLQQVVSHYSHWYADTNEKTIHELKSFMGDCFHQAGAITMNMRGKLKTYEWDLEDYKEKAVFPADVLRSRLIDLQKTIGLYRFFLNQGLGQKQHHPCEIFDQVLASEHIDLKNTDREGVQEAIQEEKKQKIRIKGLGLQAFQKQSTVLEDYRLFLVFQNLVHNAVKYTPTGGQIEIDLKEGVMPQTTASATCKAKPALVLTITDTGIGIPPGEIPKIRKGQRASNTQGINGTGHGIRRVNSILQGHLEIISPVTAHAEEKGSRFTAYIPLQPP